MDYGNTFQHLKNLSKFCLAISILCYPVAIAGALATRLWETMPWRVVFLVALAPIIFLLLLLSTTLFCIRIKDGVIQYLFLKRYIIKQKKLADLVLLNISSKGCPALFVFQDKSRICFQPGAHLVELHRLADDVKRLTDGRVQII